MVRSVDAASLFDFRRLDLVVKFRFFRSILSNVDLELNERLYRWHILERTGGSEPRDFTGRMSDKKSLDDYVAGCHELLISVQEQGFDPRQAVPMGSNGLPLNGAHRIAAAAALGVQVIVDDFDVPGGTWDFDWFRQSGLDRDDLSRLLHSWVVIKAASTRIFLFWGPALALWDQMTQVVHDDLHVVGAVDIGFSNLETESFSSLIYDLYAFEGAHLTETIAHISRKVEFLLESPLFIRAVVAHGPAQTIERSTKDLKVRLRDLCHPVVDTERFVTCHSSDGVEETLYISSILLSPTNIDHVRLRKARLPRTMFVTWLSGLRSKLRALGIPFKNSCIVGSGALEGVGARLATDIDITLTQDLRNNLFDSGVTRVEDKLDVVTEGYHKRLDGRSICDDALIESPECHYICLGFKAAALSIVYERKAFSRRPKDLLDIEILEQFPWAAQIPTLNKDQVAQSASALRGADRTLIPQARTVFDGRSNALSGGERPAGFDFRPNWRQSIEKTGGASDANRCVVVSGDIFRFEPSGAWEQAYNVSLVASLASAMCATLPSRVRVIGPSDLGVTPEMSDRRLDVWRERHQGALTPGLEAELRNLLADSAYVGFETPDNIWHVVEACCDIALDLRIHPCRYADDLLFLARSKGFDLNELVDQAMIERELVLAAELIKLDLQRGDRLKVSDQQDALLALQHPVDSALMEAYDFVSITDHAETIERVATSHRQLLVKPHPYIAPALEVARLVLTIPNARVTTRNTYEILGSGSIKTVTGLSSSVLHEADRFGVNVEAIRPDLSHGYPPKDIYTALTLHDLLGSVGSAFSGQAPSFAARGAAWPLKAGMLRKAMRQTWTPVPLDAVQPALPPLPRAVVGLGEVDLQAARSYGWSEPESWGVWSLGYLSTLDFTWPAADVKSVQVSLECWGQPHALASVNLEVWSQGTMLTRATLPPFGRGRAAVVIFDLHRPMFGQLVQISLLTDSPYLPHQDSDSGDRRSLAVAYLSIQAVY